MTKRYDALLTREPVATRQRLIEIPRDKALELAIDAIHSERLAVICGAGLSMASPSRLPSAAQLSARAKAIYDALHGTSRPPLPTDIEEQATFFFENEQLTTVYLRTLIDPNVFAGRPNAGHFAVADLMLTRAIQFVVSTNVDVMIEHAGQQLYGGIRPCLDGNSVATLPPSVSPMLKVHGCWQSDPDNTVWTPRQLSCDPIAGRIESSAECLSHRLRDRDILLIGYFTDWDYLNRALTTALGGVRPTRVIVINPDDAASLSSKAAELFSLASRDESGSSFFHVKESADTFLHALRVEFSRGFIRRVITSAKPIYESSFQRPFDASWAELEGAEVQDLWQLRRDLEGCGPSDPASQLKPLSEPALGLALAQLRAAGAVSAGSLWELNGRRIRIIRALGQFLHEVQSIHSPNTPPVAAPDITVAFGAETVSLPPNIVRSGGGSIARGAAGSWMTWGDATGEVLT